MKWIYRLERKLGRNFGIANLMLYVTATMLVVYLTQLLLPNLPLISNMYLSRIGILAGQVWRLVTFLLIPPVGGNNTLLLIIALYAMFHLGTSLENAWGKTLFTIYYILGAVGAIAAGLIGGIGENSYIYLSMLLAFCYLYPETTFMVFFVLPVKAKYIAILNWALYVYSFVFSSWSGRLAIAFSLLNFFMFFGPNVLDTIKRNYKQSKRKREYRKNWGGGKDWR